MTDRGPAAATFDFAGGYDEIDAHYQERGWTDGLPIVPPTEARVHAFLAETDRDPREVVGVLPPRQGEATVEKLAVNAVMAGCRPEYFPVIPPRSRRSRIRCSISTPSRPPRIRWRRCWW
jgi:hypothetical protein